MKKVFLFVVIKIFLSVCGFTQAPSKPKAVLSEGIVVVGYVNDGGFINFAGPSVKMTHKPTWSLGLGMLPGLRIKKDNSSTTKNSTFFPSLGFGFTYTYKHFAIQLPVYYNAKTSAADGKWVAGFGIGYKF